MIIHFTEGKQEMKQKIKAATKIAFKNHLLPEILELM